MWTAILLALLLAASEHEMKSSSLRAHPFWAPEMARGVADPSSEQ